MSTLNIPDIKKHSDVIASCGTKVGTVDHLEGDNQLKLTRDENDQHHLIPTGWIGEVKGDKVVLIKNSEEVKQQWQGYLNYSKIKSTTRFWSYSFISL